MIEQALRENYVCRAPVLDPWWRLLWAYGHGKCLHAVHFSADPDVGRQLQPVSETRTCGDSQTSGAAQRRAEGPEIRGPVHVAAEVPLDCPSSTLVKFSHTANTRCATCVLLRPSLLLRSWHALRLHTKLPLCRSRCYM